MKMIKLVTTVNKYDRSWNTWKEKQSEGFNLMNWRICEEYENSIKKLGCEIPNDVKVLYLFVIREDTINNWYLCKILFIASKKSDYKELVQTRASKP